jgi:hypothetical protein
MWPCLASSCIGREYFSAQQDAGKNDYENEHLNCVCHRIHHRRSSNRIFASGEIMIRVIQCLCKRQHCIMGMAYDPRTKPSNDAMFQFRVLVESSVQRNYFPSECALCKCPSDDWHYIDMNTKFSTLEEARPVLELFEILERVSVKAARN